MVSSMAGRQMQTYPNGQDSRLIGSPTTQFAPASPVMQQRSNMTQQVRFFSL